MKKIDYTTSEKSIKRRLKADNSRICINVKNKKDPTLLPQQMLMRRGETLVITFDIVLLKESAKKGDDRVGSSGREVISLQKEDIVRKLLNLSKRSALTMCQLVTKSNLRNFL
jgi:hypothetical protein